MDVLEDFLKVSALICEPARSKILWSLLDGKAYTATELASFADISITSASNHLSKLLEAEILKVEVQGRHRYYNFANSDVAYAIEALAQLSKKKSGSNIKEIKVSGIKYCRTCYDHLAGLVGVQLFDMMISRDYIRKEDEHFLVTKNGWDWLQDLDIRETDYENIRRPIIRPCLDWSERRVHLAGQLGADLLDKMLQKKWFKKVQFSRELVITAKGRKEIYHFFGVSLQ